ncbi:MAG: methyltransferase domain-containing protein [Myxococcales bacterium]|nr:methyltransferase domain-containing protein [Myxococcales bacterium]
MTQGTVDFGRAADDYAKHRQGFPAEFLARLQRLGLGTPGQQVVDVGTGTGTLARQLAALGCVVDAVDRSPEMVAVARRLAADQQLSIAFHNCGAEDTGLPSGQADLVIAGQCWHWFDQQRAIAEAWRLLTPGGALVVCHLDWLQLPGNIVDVSVGLAHRQHSGAPPASELPVHGMYPRWLPAIETAGFQNTETFGFTHDLQYTPEAWRGRMRASALVGGSLSEAAVMAYDASLASVLTAQFSGDHLRVPHRVWALISRKPPAGPVISEQSG